MRFRLWVMAMLVSATILNGAAEETNSSAVVEDLFAAPRSATTNIPAGLLPVRYPAVVSAPTSLTAAAPKSTNNVEPDTVTAADSSAVVEDLFAAPLAATNIPPKLLPALNVRRYLIEGNTLLPPREFGMLSNYTGTLTMARVRAALDALGARYVTLGYSNVSLTLPDQKFTNDVVRIRVLENQKDAVAGADLATAITNLFAAPKPTFEVRGYLVEGNTVLPPEKLSFLTNYTGAVDFPRLREGLGNLQLLYRDLGFPTVSVTLPQQKLTNGIVRVKVIEGKICAIIVEGNRYYSSNNIVRALPSLATNIYLNTKWFQPELDRANLNQDRQIYPVIAPGPTPGTTELTLKVKDQLPLHGHIELNNYSTPDTPLLRVDTAVQYDNLWQSDHQVGFDYNFSPTQMKSDTYWPDFYDQPMVASYSGYYRLPLGNVHGLRENYDNMPVDFGYDQVTHKFNLPPATGNPDLIFYASRAVSDTPVRNGPITFLSSTTNQDVYSQSSERDLTIDANVGTKLTIPLREFFQIQSSWQLGFDYKSYESDGYTTNSFLYNVYVLNGLGQRVGLDYSQTLANPENTHNSLYYFPLSVGWLAARPDSSGSFNFNYNQSIFLSPLASPRHDFQAVAGSSQAGGNYTTINLGLSRVQNLPHAWSLFLRANGQWASAPLISNEQFALGGTEGVRGYPNGEDYGDNGWRVLLDVRAPAVIIGYLPTNGRNIPADLRCSWFMDYGETYDLDQPTVPVIRQWGTGLGFYLTATEHFDARLTLGYALAQTPTTPVGSLQAYFSVGLQF